MKCDYCGKSIATPQVKFEDNEVKFICLKCQAREDQIENERRKRELE